MKLRLAHCRRRGATAVKGRRPLPLLALSGALTALTALSAQGGSPATTAEAARSCRPLLAIAGDQGDTPAAEALRLDSCDFDAQTDAGLVLRPRGPARAALAEALGPGGRYFEALLAGRLQLGPATRSRDLAGFPAGLLLAAESARLVEDGHWRWDAGARALRWQPRRTAWSEAQQQACQGLAGKRVFLWGGALDRQGGELIAARPFVPGHAPGFETLVPPACITAWSLSPQAPARIDAATGVVVLDSTALRSSPQAFTVIAQVGEGRAEGRVSAFDARQQPLVGSWARTEERDCGMTGAPAPARLLALSADGRFTWRQEAFEARYDAWGRYTHGLDTGALALRVEGGNDTDGLQRLDARASLNAEGQLVLTAPTFSPSRPGRANYPSGCAWVYVRQAS